MGKAVTAPKKRPNGETKPKRRSPITRAEGERRLISAATELIQTRPYSDVGVRDIAELADVNHGFVHTWFGSKNDLLLAVVRKQFEELADQVRKAEPGQPALNFYDPRVVSVVRLVLWLDLEGVDTGNLFKDMPILDALTARFISIEKIDPSIARAAAIQAISIGLGAGTFAPILGMESADDAVPIMDLWRHVVGLLSKYPPA
jgi:AcrR family transcriptional regulator